MSNNASHLSPYQFKPGVTGNPGGRPKKIVTAEVIDYLKKNTIETGQYKGKSFWEVFIMRIADKAVLKGEAMTLHKLWEHIDGSPSQAIDLMVADEAVDLPPDILDEIIKQAREKLTKAKTGKKDGPNKG